MCAPDSAFRQETRPDGSVITFMPTPPMPHEMDDCSPACAVHDHFPCLLEAVRDVSRRIGADLARRQQSAILEAFKC